MITATQIHATNIMEMHFMATWCATLSLIMQTALNNLLQPNTLHLDHQAKRPNTAHRPQTPWNLKFILLAVWGGYFLFHYYRKQR